MNIKRVTCIEPSREGSPDYFYIDTADLSAEEFAELRLLIDKSAMLCTHHESKEKPDSSAEMSIIIDTNSGTCTTHRSPEALDDEIKELIEYVKYKHHDSPSELRPTA